MEQKARHLSLQLQAAAVLLLLTFFFAGHAGASSLSWDEIWEKMYAHVKEAFGYDQEELIPGTLDKYDGTWAFSVKIKDHPVTNDGLITGTMDSAGALLSIKEPFELNLQMQVAISFDDHITSMEGMYAFRQEWLPRRQTLLEADPKEQGAESGNGFLKMAAQLITEIGLPGEEDITGEEALEKARERTTALLGWPREKLDFFAVIGEAYLTPQDIGKPVYQFIFSGRKRTAEEMDDGAAGRAFDEYLQEFHDAFGGAENVPRFITIRIDAKTGGEVEEPWILFDEDMAGYDYRDLFVR